MIIIFFDTFLLLYIFSVFTLWEFSNSARWTLYRYRHLVLPSGATLLCGQRWRSEHDRDVMRQCSCNFLVEVGKFQHFPIFMAVVTQFSAEAWG